MMATNRDDLTVIASMICLNFICGVAAADMQQRGMVVPDVNKTSQGGGRNKR